jgi:hypothetical protein
MALFTTLKILPSLLDLYIEVMCKYHSGTSKFGEYRILKATFWLGIQLSGRAPA